MQTRIVRVSIDAPETIGEAARLVAEERAREAAVLSLWEQAELSTRQAADELGLHYQDFLDLLTAKGIPVERGEPNLAAVEDARCKLAGRRS
jgi:hypothetical protein